MQEPIDALAKKLEDVKAELEQAIKTGKQDNTTELEKMAGEHESLKNELESKDRQLQSLLIVTCIISGVAFVGCGSFVIWFFIDRKKRI